MHIIALVDSNQKNTLTALEEMDGAGIVKCDSAEECFGLLQILPDIDAVVFDDSFLHSILKALKESDVKVDLVYLGGKDVDVELVYFRKVKNLVELVSYLNSGLKVTPLLESDDITYTKITVSSLKSISKCPVDFYLRIKNGKFYNYIKYFEKNSQLDHSKVNEQIEKGLTDYFIVSKDLPDFSSYLTSFYQKVLNQKNLKGETLSHNSIAQIFSQLNSIGFSEEGCRVAFSAIENFSKSSNKRLMSEMRDIFKNKNSFRFKKSMMTSIMLTNFSKKLKWLSVENKNSLNLCAFLCDRELKEDDMCFIAHEAELNVSKYHEAEQKKILNHALNASLWADSFDEFPSELGRLIKQHHGSVSGHGFAREFSSQITLVSILYILIESVSLKILLSSSGKLNIGSIVKEVKSDFVSPKLHSLADEFLLFLKEELS
jgi:hypothetical protein